MGYKDIKDAARDLTKAALNGSPYWRVGVTAAVAILAVAIGFVWYHKADAGEVQAQVTQALAPIKDDVKQIKQDVSEGKAERRNIQELLIGDKLLETRQNQCKALLSGDGGVIFWTQKLRELKEKFLTAIGKPYETPTCREIGVPVNAGD